MLPFDLSSFKKYRNSYPDSDWADFVVKTKKVEEIIKQECQEQTAFEALRKAEIPRDGRENRKYYDELDQAHAKQETLRLSRCSLQEDLQSLADKLKPQIEASKNKPIQITYLGVIYEFFITSDVIPVSFKTVGSL